MVYRQAAEWTQLTLLFRATAPKFTGLGFRGLGLELGLGV